MDFGKLDQIYHALTNQEYSKLKNYNSEQIDCVLRIKFKNDANLRNKINTFRISEVRPGQHNFRERLIETFKGTCAIRKHISLEICEACHLRHFSLCDYEEDKYDTANGILLCANLHIAFDKNFFYIDEHTCQVKISNQIPEYDWEKYDLLGIEGTYISELDNEKSRKYLSFRNNNIFKN